LCLLRAWVSCPPSHACMGPECSLGSATLPGNRYGDLNQDFIVSGAGAPTRAARHQPGCRGGIYAVCNASLQPCPRRRFISGAATAAPDPPQLLSTHQASLLLLHSPWERACRLTTTCLHRLPQITHQMFSPEELVTDHGKQQCHVAAVLDGECWLPPDALHPAYPPPCSLPPHTMSGHGVGLECAATEQ
jgi:hypothetical protein